jgi:hypothetical protein
MSCIECGRTEQEVISLCKGCAYQANIDMNQKTLDRINKIGKVQAAGYTELAKNMTLLLAYGDDECSESFCDSCPIPELCKFTGDYEESKKYIQWQDTTYEVASDFKGTLKNDVVLNHYPNVAFFVDHITLTLHDGVINEEIFNLLRDAFYEVKGAEPRGTLEDYIDWILAGKPDFF